MPVVKIVVSDYGIASVVDLEGNCRLYDLLRLNKLAKISSKTPAIKTSQTSWRLIPEPVLIATGDAFLGAIQGQEVHAFD